MRLNGWQRMWVVLSALSGLLAIGIVITQIGSTDQPEESSFYLESLKDNVTIVEIDTVGEVHFPSELSKEEIGRLVKQEMSTSPSTVKEVAAKELQKRAVLRAAQSRVANLAARSENLRLYFYAGSFWLGFVTIVYVVGWSIGWVRRGFRAT